MYHFCGGLFAPFPKVEKTNKGEIYTSCCSDNPNNVYTSHVLDYFTVALIMDLLKSQILVCIVGMDESGNINSHHYAHSNSSSDSSVFELDDMWYQVTSNQFVSDNTVEIIQQTCLLFLYKATVCLCQVIVFLLFIIVYFYRDSAQLKLIAPELPDR